MSQSHFVVKSTKKLDDLKIGDQIPESDFATLTPAGNFVQLEYVEAKETVDPYRVEPGIWTIKVSPTGMKLEPTSFINDKILEQFSNTQDIETKIDCFFRNLHKYKELGFEIPRRAMLLFGPPGCGKTTSIITVSNKYAADNETAVIVWSTDKLEAYHVKAFFKRFEYGKVKKVILIAEDIGGVEVDNVRMKSDSSLLSLLDNKEKVFTVPIFIIATTNFPENFLGNLTNRPGRFDDKVEVKPPTGALRQELLKFYSKNNVDATSVEEIGKNAYKDFSPAHIQDVIVRSVIYEKSVLECIKEMALEIQHYKNLFQNKGKLGIE